MSKKIVKRKNRKTPKQKAKVKTATTKKQAKRTTKTKSSTKTIAPTKQPKTPKRKVKSQAPQEAKAVVFTENDRELLKALSLKVAEHDVDINTLKNTPTDSSTLTARSPSNCLSDNQQSPSSSPDISPSVSSSSSRSEERKPRSRRKRKHSRRKRNRSHRSRSRSHSRSRSRSQSRSKKSQPFGSFTLRSFRQCPEAKYRGQCRGIAESTGKRCRVKTTHKFDASTICPLFFTGYCRSHCPEKKQKYCLRHMTKKAQKEIDFIQE